MKYASFFDSILIESSIYGYEIFSKLIPLLDRKSTYSILAGDYIDIMSGITDTQLLLKNELNEKTNKYSTSVYQHSSQYYLVYINSITNGQLSMIITGLQKYK